MSFELVYTSARKGLRPGASGFCTVAATDGIPRNLQDKLESLSGYRQTEATAGSEQPVNFMHSTIRIQRKVYHVLSRIGNAGKDYTGRTNKIAHHLALGSAELEQFPDGPEAMFGDHAFWLDHWDSDPQTFTKNRQPEPYPEPVDDFSTWSNVFGDAGWAGLLGEAISDGLKSVSVIVPDHKDTMTLVAEAFQLIKPENRWKVCFSTYYQRQVSGTQCHWRFLLEGTSEAKKLRGRAQGVVVDPLGGSGELPDENLFVEAARDNRPESVHEIVSSENRRRISIRQTQVEDDGDEDGEKKLRPSQRRRMEARKKQTQPKETKSPFDIPEEEYAHVRVSDEPQTSGKRRGRGRKSSRQKKKQQGLLIVAVLGLAVVAIIAYWGIQQLS